MEKKIHGNIHKLSHHLLLDPKFMLLSLFQCLMGTPLSQAL